MWHNTLYNNAVLCIDNTTNQSRFTFVFDSGRKANVPDSFGASFACESGKDFANFMRSQRTTKLGNAMVECYVLAVREEIVIRQVECREL